MSEKTALTVYQSSYWVETVFRSLLNLRLGYDTLDVAMKPWGLDERVLFKTDLEVDITERAT